MAKRNSNGDSNVTVSSTLPGHKSEGSKQKKKWWAKPKPNLPMVMLMFKGSLPMTIGLAMLQSTWVANRYTSVGYLISMVAFFSFATMPQAKYLQNLLANMIAINLSAAVSLLGLWCGIQTRYHTESITSKSYNSSQAAVCAIWFFAAIWFSNLLRVKFPAIQTAIFISNVATMIMLTYGPRFSEMSQCIDLVVELIELFYLAFGIATGVSLLIFLTTSRGHVFQDQKSYILSLQDIFKSQTAYLRSIEDAGSSKSLQDSQDQQDTNNERADLEPHSKKPEAIALKTGVDHLKTLHSKLYQDMIFAKREIAFGKLDADDFEEIFRYFRTLLQLSIGDTTIIGNFDKIAKSPGWTKGEYPSHLGSNEIENSNEKTKEDERRIWSRVMIALHEPFVDIAEAMDLGLEHVGILLEILRHSGSKSGKAEDVESKGDVLSPGDDMFSQSLDKKIHSARATFLKDWMKEKSILQQGKGESGKNEQDLRHEQHLYIMLYLQHLLYHQATAVQELVLFADIKVREGVTGKHRLVYPSWKRPKNWFLPSAATSDAKLDSTDEAGRRNGKGHDPEHLPPRNPWERCSNHFRVVPSSLQSEASHFGFRTALAAMSIGILAYLRKTYNFYYDQQVIWTMIVLVIGMSTTSGQSTFALFGRLLGTVVAVVVSLVCWYIVDGQPA